MGTKLIFICGCLEPGRDGVGDYTTRLASELISRGHNARIIALNDKFVTEQFNGVYIVENSSIPVLRLPVALSMAARYAQSKAWVDEFDPEWVSLQFVPFSFDKKGLIFGLARYLQRLGNSRHWHIMFHETWVGMAQDENLKMKVWGWVQQRMIKRLLKFLNADLVHTHTPLYQYQLQKLGIKVKILPLYGNLPVRNSNYAKKRSNGILTVILFGGIHYGAPILEFIDNLSSWNKSNNYKFRFLFAGNNGKEREGWATALRREGFEVNILGFLEPEEVASTLIDADIGITTTPRLLVAKSGAVAAMREYGLPVVCVARDWVVKGFSESSSLVMGLAESLDFALNGKRAVNYNALADCTEIFINDINLNG